MLPEEESNQTESSLESMLQGNAEKRTEKNYHVKKKKLIVETTVKLLNM